MKEKFKTLKTKRSLLTPNEEKLKHLRMMYSIVSFLAIFSLILTIVLLLVLGLR